MPDEIRYQTCRHCSRKTKVEVPETMRQQAGNIEVQCHNCLKYFVVDLNKPSEHPPTESVYRE